MKGMMRVVKCLGMCQRAEWGEDVELRRRNSGGKHEEKQSLFTLGCNKSQRSSDQSYSPKKRQEEEQDKEANHALSAGEEWKLEVITKKQKADDRCKAMSCGVKLWMSHTGDHPKISQPVHYMLLWGNAGLQVTHSGGLRSNITGPRIGHSWVCPSSNHQPDCRKKKS